jgi:hypothetical protein
MFGVRETPAALERIAVRFLSGAREAGTYQSAPSASTKINRETRRKRIASEFFLRMLIDGGMHRRHALRFTRKAIVSIEVS